MEPAACACLICTGADPGREATTVRHVNEFGWSVVRVTGQVEFAYTIGLWHSLRQPELVMFGLNGADMHGWLNACVTHCRDGGWPVDGVEFVGVLDSFPTQLRAVHPSWHDALFGTAYRFYQRTPLTLRQLVWPDGAGVWPWEPDATATSRTRQAFAWLAVEEHPPGGWRLVGEMGADFPLPAGPDAHALTPRSLLHSGGTIARVVRHEDGGYDVLDERGYAADDLCVVFVGDLVRCQPRLAGFAALKSGDAATVQPDGTWTTTPLGVTERDAAAAARHAVAPV